MASEPREVWGDLATTAFIEASLMFRSLDDDARRDLLHLARVVEFAPGEVVSAAGDDGFYLVRDGRAAVVAAGGGGQVEVATLERGAFFGESRVLGAEAEVALSAQTEVAVVAFPAPMIAALAERYPRMRKLLDAVRNAREKESASRRV
jgi:CRP-like cAMP-binding protein